MNPKRSFVIVALLLHVLASNAAERRGWHIRVCRADKAIITIRLAYTKPDHDPQSGRAVIDWVVGADKTVVGADKALVFWCMTQTEAVAGL